MKNTLILILSLVSMVSLAGDRKVAAKESGMSESRKIKMLEEEVELLRLQQVVMKKELEALRYDVIFLKGNR